MVERVVKEPEGGTGCSDSDDNDGTQVHPAPRSIPVKEVFYVP